ncbi:MAG TPA: DinB family protein [Candidatus Acidoferrum sp.]|jgi:hypothetical protein
MKRKPKPMKRKKAPSESGGASLREHLVQLLTGGEAHASFSDAIANFPADKRGALANGLPHSAWQLLEHIRIAQWDILEFSRDPKHVSPEFPDGYWPKTPEPPSDAVWEKSVNAVERDLQAMVALIKDPHSDLHAKFLWGAGQTLLREALLVADHNAYHVAQIVDLRRALQIWDKS